MSLLIYNTLGKTGLKVSKIAFGALTIGPLQRNLTPNQGGKVISYALERGINFIDTADLYQTYPHIQRAICNYSGEVIIATKSYDYNEEGARKSLYKALRALKRDTIDLFLLHEQESIHTLRGHWKAIEFLLREKEKGTIRGIGLSTHRIEGVLGACQCNEIDVIHPIINIQGLGIEDGTRDEMVSAIHDAYTMGKGIYAMKIFGGGNLIHRTQECFNFIKGLDCIHAMAVGMQTEAEVDYNIHQVLGENIPDHIMRQIHRQKRKLIIEHWCIGCGECVKNCHQKALYIQNDRAKVNKDKCLLCGYCGAHCPQFCIKIV
ncbi:MAG: aldo/keto reductase [Eubacteriales bacterium]